MNQQRARLLVLLFVLLSSIYMITYSARIESGDTGRFFDAVSSFADFGDFYLDQFAWQFPPQDFGYDIMPLQNANVEPLQVILAAPLYIFARIVPGIGLVHTVYLFNVIVVAAAGCVLFIYALALGYSEGTAVLVVVMFGVGTAIFPYTKSFFREPLVLLVLLICGLLIERLRVQRYRSLPLWIAVVIGLILLLLAKASSLLAIPALIVIGLPDLRSVLSRRVLIVLAGLITLAALLVIFFNATSAFGGRYNIAHFFTPDAAAYLTTALQAYLLSVGGSIWGTSPVILLALPGMIILALAGRWRYPLAIVLLVGAFALGYAALNGHNWFGGLSWPPRFLIPTLPFVMLTTLPILERIRRQPIWATIVTALLIYGVWVQLSGVTLDWNVYSSHLPPEAHGLEEWGGGLNDLRYLRWVITPQLWGSIPLDIAWSVINAPGMMIAFAGLAIVALIGLIGSLRRAASRLVFLTPLALIVIVGFGLHLLYTTDPRYLSSDTTLFDMLPIMRAQTNSSDIILLSSPRYEPFFINSGKLYDAGRIVTLPLQPGETPSPEAQPQIRSQDPMALLTKETIQIIYNFAGQHERLWLLVNGGPDLTWDVRPVERFMDSHYYPIQTFQTGSLTRLIEYSTISAPNQFAYREPDNLTDLTFDNHLHLAGYELPSGADYKPGDVVAISTYWQTDTPISDNDTIGLYLRDASGAPVAQVDGQPGGGFYPTSGWQVDVPVWDNRAIRLPADLPAGTYQLWVKVYNFDVSGTVHDLPLTAGQKVADDIGLLPITINVK